VTFKRCACTEQHSDDGDQVDSWTRLSRVTDCTWIECLICRRVYTDDTELSAACLCAQVIACKQLDSRLTGVQCLKSDRLVTSEARTYTDIQCNLYLYSRQLLWQYNLCHQYNGFCQCHGDVIELARSDNFDFAVPIIHTGLSGAPAGASLSTSGTKVLRSSSVQPYLSWSLFSADASKMTIL